MLQQPPEIPGAEQLVLSSDLTHSLGSEFRLRRAAERGVLHRLARGAYVHAESWQGLTDAQRYALRVRAAGLNRRGDAVISHQSAAALWGLPMLAAWPAEVHLLVERSAGGRSKPGVRKHALGITAEDVTVIDGLQITTVARTVVDLSATVDLKSAVAAVDRALFIDRRGGLSPLTTKAELLATWQRMLPFRGSVCARAIIEFGSHKSGSPLESGSRVNVALSGFPEPELQHPFIIDGDYYEADFYWRQFNAVGEADGRGKYFDPRMLAGRTPEEAVYLEKLREDAIRRVVSRFTRWDFPTGMSQYRLRSRLLELGLPMSRARLGNDAR